MIGVTQADRQRYSQKVAIASTGMWQFTGPATGFERHNDLLAQSGRHKIGKSCLYINKLADVDIDVLGQLVSMSFEQMNATG